MGPGRSQQVDDFDPGEEDGLFWPVAMPEDSVDADLDDGTASLILTHFYSDALRDRRPRRRRQRALGRWRRQDVPGALGARLLGDPPLSRRIAAGASARSEHGIRKA